MCTVSSVNSLGVTPMFCAFDWDHWSRVRAARLTLGLPRRSAIGETVQHALVGCAVLDTTTDTRYVVESVKKDWYQGWFLVGLLNTNGSHRTCVVENLSSRDGSIQALAKDFSRDFVRTDS